MSWHFPEHFTKITFLLINQLHFKLLLPYLWYSFITEMQFYLHAAKSAYSLFLTHMTVLSKKSEVWGVYVALHDLSSMIQMPGWLALNLAPISKQEIPP